MSTDTNWGQWLRAQLDERGWTQADFVRKSGQLIRADRVSKWSRGIELPTHRNVLVTANVLGVDHKEALVAAGFSPVELPPVAATVRLRDFTSTELLEELLSRERSRESSNRT